MSKICKWYQDNASVLFYLWDSSKCDLIMKCTAEWKCSSESQLHKSITRSWYITHRTVISHYLSCMSASFLARSCMEPAPNSNNNDNVSTICVTTLNQLQQPSTWTALCLDQSTATPSVLQYCAGLNQIIIYWSLCLVLTHWLCELREFFALQKPAALSSVFVQVRLCISNLLGWS